MLTWDSAFRIANKAQKAIDAEAFVESIAPFFGPATGGTVITITGRFLGKTADDLIGVSFGSFSATKVQWQSSTQITCVTPPVCAAADAKRGQQLTSECIHMCVQMECSIGTRSSRLSLAASARRKPSSHSTQASSML